MLNKELQQDEDVAVAAITGEGSYYSSGNDLKGFAQGMASGKSPDVLAMVSLTIQ